jgi:hypothetical protein
LRRPRGDGRDRRRRRERPRPQPLLERATSTSTKANPAFTTFIKDCQCIRLSTVTQSNKIPGFKRAMSNVWHIPLTSNTGRHTSSTFTGKSMKKLSFSNAWFTD